MKQKVQIFMAVMIALMFFLRDYCLGNKRTVKIKRGTPNTDFYVRNQESGECI